MWLPKVEPNLQAKMSVYSQFFQTRSVWYLEQYEKYSRTVALQYRTCERIPGNICPHWSCSGMYLQSSIYSKVANNTLERLQGAIFSSVGSSDTILKVFL
uniref:Uncharacterized protein n=1 Tax=Pyxicephalus adspersus TaxID=30357 RepID=A0AAV3AL85_PYXAD|nr:TPA: hypothetical protein GDO54_012762 [Pyxicephalus adspersus]